MLDHFEPHIWNKGTLFWVKSKLICLICKHDNMPAAYKTYNGVAQQVAPNYTIYLVAFYKIRKKVIAGMIKNKSSQTQSIQLNNCYRILCKKASVIISLWITLRLIRQLILADGTGAP